jgi:hypothetical protein
MGMRVLADPRALELITQMKGQISDGLLTQINALIKTGTDLSNREIWDGPKAVEFGELWADQISPALTNAHAQLEELAGKVDQITSDIMAAGGNAG